MATKKKTKEVGIVLPKGVAAWVHVLTPDDKQIEGAAWKPDGKFKITLIYDDVSNLDDVRAKILTAAKEKWPDLDEEEFVFPWRERDDSDKNEGLRGKVTLKASSKYAPKIVDSKRNPLPKSVKIFGGDIVKASGTLYLYEKTEKVKEGKKMVDVTIQGASIQLGAVQLIEKRAGGSDAASMFDDEDGYVADSEAPDNEDDDVSGDF